MYLRTKGRSDTVRRVHGASLDAGMHSVAGNAGVGICVDWQLAALASGEPEHVDTALHPNLRPPIHEPRQRLLSLLATSRIAAPNDSFLLGQHVRFLVDADSLERAMTEIEQCAESNAWCAMLASFVSWRKGATAAAERAFLQGDSLAGAASRCDLGGLHLLVARGDQLRFNAMECEKQRAYAAQMWWLADPLFSRAGNERWVEHRGRNTQFALHAALDRDELFDRQPAAAGMVRELMIRYAWPSVASWTPGHDESHKRYLSRHGGGMRPPYLSPEYSPNRIAIIPKRALIENAFSSLPKDWLVNTGRGDEKDPVWPREHFVRRLPFARSRSFSMALFGGTTPCCSCSRLGAFPP